ncbi:ABC transporter ATP-binding protein [Peredibacter sp. HCB2-198]|uniref:ABC transporter ATP-binding protein n=1 Tax=Peredibacter sp. HCB2-198 TaxID=3383025 RepID=UPI0038B65EB1
MINAKSLVKTFGDFTAVNNLDLSIKQGECFGLLGPNGAGKSTFISMTYGTVQRTGGELSVFGYDPRINSREIKKRMGVVTQDNALDESLTVMENMMIYCAFIGVPRHERQKRVLELLDYMNLTHKKDTKILTLSGGMKRRLVFVRALLGRPELLILDEPTTGLDPAVRHLLWGKVKELHQQGTTIVLTTHYMHEAEVLCNRLVIMNHGKVSAEGTPKDMIHQHTPGFVGIFKLEDRLQLEKLSQQKSFHFNEDASGIYVRAHSLHDLTSLHSDHGLNPLQIRPSNLEDVFLKLTGQELSADA